MVDVTPYHTRDELISAFLNLEVQYPDKISHQIVGKTTEGRDIYLFKIGNPNGGRVLFSATHGNELLGPEIYLRYAQWLLENREPGASDRILSNNLTLIVPHMNLDRYKSTRTNQGSRKNSNSVDLNRNFAATWRADCISICESCCSSNAECGDTYQCIGMKTGRQGNCYKSGCDCFWSPFPEDYNYRGTAPESEQETKVMRQLHEEWQPSFFLDYHIWKDFFAKPSSRARRKAEAKGVGTYDELTAKHDEVAQKITDLAAARGVKVYSYTTLGVCGSHIDEALVSGSAISYLIEGDNNREDSNAVQTPYEEIDTIFFPAFLPFAIVFSQECEVPSPPPPPPTVIGPGPLGIWTFPVLNWIVTLFPDVQPKAITVVNDVKERAKQALLGD